MKKRMEKRMKKDNHGGFGEVGYNENNYDGYFREYYEQSLHEPLVRDESIDNYHFFAEVTEPVPREERKPDKFNKGMVINSDPRWGNY